MKKYSKEIKVLDKEILKRKNLIKKCQTCIKKWPKCGVSKEEFKKIEWEIKNLKQLRRYYDFINTESVLKNFNPINLNEIISDQGLEKKSLKELIEIIKSDKVLRKCFCIYKIPIDFISENKKIKITRVYTFELNKYSIDTFELDKYNYFISELQKELSKREKTRFLVIS